MQERLCPEFTQNSVWAECGERAEEDWRTIKSPTNLQRPGFENTLSGHDCSKAAEIPEKVLNKLFTPQIACVADAYTCKKKYRIMATVTTNALLSGVSGTFGNTLVFRTMRGKTFVSAKARTPDKRKETVAQRNTRTTFRQAAEWAQLTLLNPDKKLYYQQRAKALKLPNAYTAAITDYMRKPKVVKVKHRDAITYDISKPGFAIKHIKALLTDTNNMPVHQPRIVMHSQNDRWVVQYTPDNSSVSLLRLIITDNSLLEITFEDVPMA